MKYAGITFSYITTVEVMLQGATSGYSVFYVYEPNETGSEGVDNSAYEADGMIYSLCEV